jgi:AraC family transcriptional regulator
MEDGASHAPMDALGIVAQTPGVRLVYVIACAHEGGLSAARWKLDDCRMATGGSAQNILAFRTSGSAVVTRRTDDGAVRRRPAIGAATFISAQTRVRWSVEGSSESLHVYIPQAALSRFAEQELDAACPPPINEFFAVVDPWLRGYLQMLSAEADAAWADGRASDALLLDETEHALLRRLFQGHCCAEARRAASRARAPMPLQSSVMERVQAYVDAHLAEDIHLHDLATLGYMSPGHFLRRFRATCGTTPYQYVLEQRLQRARVMLRQSADPIAHIARECGFGTASHLCARFHARFGLRPSTCRDAGTAPRMPAGTGRYDRPARGPRARVQA